MIRNLKIRYKFLLLAILGVSAILLILFLIQNILLDSLIRSKSMFDNVRKVEHLQHNYIIPLFQLREETLFLDIESNNKDKNQIQKNISPLIERLNNSFTLLDENIKHIWENYRNLIFTVNGYKNYKRFIYLSEGYMDHDDKIGAFMHTKKVERELFYTLISELQKLQTLQSKTSYQIFTQLQDNFNEKILTITCITIIIIFLMLLFGFLIARNIVFSLECVQDGLRKFFDLLEKKIDNKEIKININNQDEFGDIAKEINCNIEILRNKLNMDFLLIKDATNVFTNLKEGKLDKRLTEFASSNELNILKAVMNEMLDNLENRIELEIQERIKQEKLLIQQSKLACMGNMIGNIAHQWRQPLGEINAILLNMQIKKDNNDLSPSTFDESMRECDIILSHMSQTISDFQNFYKPSKEKILFYLEEACNNACFIIESTLENNNIQMITEIEEDCKVYGYSREFSQAILNILSNAKDALLERKIENPYIKLTIKKGFKYAIVKIQDNAGGIPEKIFEKIFEPYFTTKHEKQGSGIGLYMCKIIIEDNMNGYINAKNVQNGVLFTIKISSS